MAALNEGFALIDRLPSTWSDEAYVWQGQEWLDLNKAYGRQVWAVGLSRQDKTLSYALLFTKHPYKLTGIREWVSYLILKQLLVLNGPVVSESSTALDVHERFCELLGTKPFAQFYSQRVSPRFDYTENHLASEICKIYKRFGFFVEEDYTFLLSVNRALAELWSGVHPKRRNRVNRARRDGIEIEEVKDGSGVQRYWEMRKGNWQRNSLKPIPFDHFRQTWESLQPYGAIKIFISKLRNKDLAGQILFLSKRHIQLNGVVVSDFNIQEGLGGNDLLQWHVIEWAHQNNFYDIDYGGATPESQEPKELGIHRFKQSWGGDLVKYFSFTKKRANWLTNFVRR